MEDFLKHFNKTKTFNSETINRYIEIIESFDDAQDEPEFEEDSNKRKEA